MASNYKNIINKFNSLINHAITETRKEVFKHMKQNYIAQFFTQLRNFFSAAEKKKTEEAGTLMEQANKETKKTLKNAAIPKNILVARAKENKPTPTMENFKSALDDMFDDFDWLDSKDRTQLKQAFSEEKIAADLNQAKTASAKIEKIKPSINKNATPEEKTKVIKDQWLNTFLSEEDKNDFVNKIDTDEVIKDAFHAVVKEFEFTQVRSQIMKQMMIILNNSY